MILFITSTIWFIVICCLFFSMIYSCNPLSFDLVKFIFKPKQFLKFRRRYRLKIDDLVIYKYKDKLNIGKISYNYKISKRVCIIFTNELKNNQFDFATYEERIEMSFYPYDDLIVKGDNKLIDKLYF